MLAVGLEQMLTVRCPEVHVPLVVTLRNLHFFPHSGLNVSE